MRIFFTIFFAIYAVIVFATDSLRIAVISDVHFLASSLAKEGKALSNYENGTGRNVSDLHAVFKEVLADISASKPDILLISGDMTNHGEKESHLEFIEKIKPLQQQGIRVFAIPGNHDINIPNANAYLGDSPSRVESISAKEFSDLYATFGYSEAIRRDSASMSYLSALTDSVWLLCIDTNRYAEYTTNSISGGRILPETMDWAKSILQEANEKKITVLGMMHHGLVEHMPYQAEFFANYLIDDWRENAEILAKNGLQIVFTGHFHSNDITSLTTSNGKTIFDIETGSLAQFPFPYRYVTLAGKSLDIDTRFVKSIPNVPNLQEKYQAKMEKLSRQAIDAKLRGMGIPISDEIGVSLTEMLVKMSLLHSRGDEVLDDALRKSIERFASILGNDNFNPDLFQLDFPPADNQLKIELK